MIRESSPPYLELQPFCDALRTSSVDLPSFEEVSDTLLSQYLEVPTIYIRDDIFIFGSLHANPPEEELPERSDPVIIRGRFMTVDTDASSVELLETDNGFSFHSPMSKSDLMDFRKAGAARFVADLSLTARQDDGRREATIERVYALEEPFIGSDDSYPTNRSVLIQGMVTSYETAGGRDTPRQAGVLTVQQSRKHYIDIYLGGEALSYKLCAEKSSRNFPEYPLQGDTLSMRVYRQAGSNLLMRTFDNATLLKAGEERIRQAVKFHTEIQSLFIRESYTDGI